jgi:hypothetical protein
MHECRTGFIQNMNETITFIVRNNAKMTSYIFLSVFVIKIYSGINRKRVLIARVDIFN